MADTMVFVGDQGPVEQRIIGIELRVVYPGNYGQQEVALIPCDVRLPVSGSVNRLRINATLHTSFGDANFTGDAVMPR
jgi:hypothetical protein